MTPNNTDQSKAIDEQTYQLLKELMDEEGFQEIIEFFCSDTTQALTNLEQAITKQQTEFVGGICHKLKSSSKLIGAFKMADLSTELELYTQNKDSDRASDLLNQLKTEFSQVQQWIETEETVKL